MGETVCVCVVHHPHDPKPFTAYVPVESHQRKLTKTLPGYQYFGGERKLWSVIHLGVATALVGGTFQYLLQLGI